MKIIYDDREDKWRDGINIGKGWNQLLSETPGYSFTKRRFKTGDYTLKGFEKVVCIEKKSGWSELAGNISNKHGREKLIKEFRRMQAFPVRVVVIEDSFNSLLSFESYHNPYVKPSDLLEWVWDIIFEYDIKLICTGTLKSQRIKILTNMFETIVEKAKKGRLYHGRCEKS
jgi:hypothetical protein